MAYRDRLQASQERHRPRATTERGSQECKGAHPLSSSARAADRAADRGTSRCISPPGGRVKNGVWRLLCMIVEALVDAVAPKPDLQTLRAAARNIQRHLREPPRKRVYQVPIW